MKLTALTTLAVALLGFTSCSSTSQAPPPVGSSSIAATKGVPGGKLVQTIKITATVLAIDQAERKATLQPDGGQKFIVKAGSGAVNFGQLRVGDQINATVTQKVDVSLDTNEAPSAEEVQMIARVIAIDAGKRKVTLRLEDGTDQSFPVRADVDLSRHKVGEQVVFRVTESVAIWVEKAR